MIDGKDVQCDKCYSHEYVDVIGFKNKIQAIKESGWKVSKVGNAWYHHCPDCVDHPELQPQYQTYWWND